MHSALNTGNKCITLSVKMGFGNIYFRADRLTEMDIFTFNFSMLVATATS
jgi:hypothetical protein